MGMANSNLVQWSDEYSVQCEAIDNQHKELVRMTNELFEGCEKRDSMAYFMKAIQGAVMYAKTHFSTEEKYMQKGHYPDFAAHRKEHEDFVEEVLRQVKSFEDGHTSPLDFAKFLKNWLLNHIAISDKKYAPYLAGVTLEED
jgi:hemerythrin